MSDVAVKMNAGPDGTYTVSNGIQHQIDGLTQIQAALVVDMINGQAAFAVSTNQAAMRKLLGIT